MRPQSAKSKGRLLQKFVATEIVDSFGALEAADCRSTSMGCSGEDVQRSPLAMRLFPFSVECKNCESLNVWKAIEQCRSNCGGQTPLVVIKKNSEKPQAVLPWSVFIALVRRAHGNVDTGSVVCRTVGNKRHREDAIADDADADADGDADADADADDAEDATAAQRQLREIIGKLELLIQEI